MRLIYNFEHERVRFGSLIYFLYFFIFIGNLQDECVRCEKPLIGNSISLQRNKTCEKCLDLGDSENDEKKFALPAKQSMDTEEEADSSIGATEFSDK